MAHDAVVYHAKPAEDENALNPSGTAILVVNFDNLRLKKIKNISAFATDEAISTDDWTTVLEYLGPAIQRTAGADGRIDPSPTYKPFDVRLVVSKQDIKDTVKRLTKAMAKHKLTLKKVNVD